MLGAEGALGRGVATLGAGLGVFGAEFTVGLGAVGGGALLVPSPGTEIGGGRGVDGVDAIEGCEDLTNITFSKKSSASDSSAKENPAIQSSISKVWKKGRGFWYSKFAYNS